MRRSRVLKPLVFPAIAALAIPGTLIPRVTAEGVAPSVPAQEAGALGSAPLPPTPVPFGPGEEAVYQVKLGIISAGEARLTVAGVEDVRGFPSYRFEFGLQGGIPGVRVNDQYWSWMDVTSLATRRYARDPQQPGYNPPLRTFEIFPEESRWRRTDNGDEGKTLSSLPLDEIAFLYFIRTLPLAVGETYTYNRYFKEHGNPVVIKVLRKEQHEVPAGTFNTIVVQPIIKTSGLFSEGGKAEVYFSDDASRHVVYLRSEIPVIGSITLHLKEFKPGTPLVASKDAPSSGAVPRR